MMNTSPAPAWPARALALLCAFGVLTLSLLGFTAPSASAATISHAITGVSLGPASTTPGQQVTTTITWQVPNGTKAGDTFTLTLDPKLTRLPRSFVMKDAAGAIVATARISTSSPAVVTFTMTSYAANHIHVTGSAYIISNFAGRGGDNTFVYTTGDGTPYRSVISVNDGSGTPNRAHANKFGRWLRGDQGREIPNNFLQWIIETKTGPFDHDTIEDTVVSPQTIDCSSVVVDKGDTGGLNGSFANGSTYAATVTCSPARITVRVGSAGPGQLYRVAFDVSIPAPTGDYSNPTAFTNTATETSVVGGRPSTYRPSGRINQASAGGVGTGVVVAPTISIVKNDVAGHAADTPATSVVLPDGSIGLALRITNTGTEALKAIRVSDSVVANGDVTGLTCTFPDGSTGTAWPGPLPVGGTFLCSAQLSGVASGTAVHSDIAKVTAVGVDSQLPVSATNPYYATRGSVSVGDYVWLDRNGNGIQDRGEPGIKGALLRVVGPTGHPVTAVTGAPVNMTATDASGHYSFDQLPVLPTGQHYTVVIDQGSAALTGLQPTKQRAGTNRAADSSTGRAESFDLTHSGARDDTLDFGFVRPVSVGDYVWFDSNVNGAQDSGEPGMSGVLLTLTDANGAPVTDVHGNAVGPTTTDNSGHYRFTGLPPGQYVVSVDSRSITPGFAATPAGTTTRDRDSSTGSATSLVLAAGEQDVTLDFGFYQASQTDTPPGGPGGSGGSGGSLTDAPPLPGGNGGGSGTITDAPPLPNTGATVTSELVGGLVLGTAGVSLLVVTRRRRSATR